MPPKRPVGTKMYRAFGRRISSARLDHNLKAEVFAQRIGVTRNTVYSYERGETVPHSGRLETIADVLDLDVNELEELIANAQPPRDQVVTSEQPSAAQHAVEVMGNEVRLEIGGLRLDVRQSVPIFIRVSIGPAESELTKEPR
jgi:transcriptional regulator with XRE-family HTH domain